MSENQSHYLALDLIYPFDIEATTVEDFKYSIHGRFIK
jgi:hypothetical protein